MRTPVKKVYKTMQGKTVDIEKLRQQNETTVAVGNMNVNARGDEIGPSGTIIKTREQLMKQYYEKPKGVVSTAQEVRQENTVKPDVQQPKVVETKILNQQPIKKATPQPKTVDTFKPKSEKSGIDAALDGIE